MSVNKTIAMAFSMLVILAAASGVARAEEPAHIGYVDLRKVLLESKVGERNKAEMEKFVNAKKESLAKEEQKLKGLQQVFDKDQLILTDEQKKARQKEFQEKVQAYQKQRAEAEKEVSQKDAEFTQKAITEVRAIVAEIAKEKKLMMVFEKTAQPLYAEPGPDLTEAVMKKFDAKAK
jgi:outer membrane protein